MNKKKLFQKITAIFMSLLMLFDVGATYIQADSNGTSMNNSVSAYGTDSFGNMMSDMVNEEAEKIIQNEGYNIFSVIVGGDELNDNEALVSFETLEDATIIVALYDDACEQMLLSEKINVYKDETIAILEFDTEDMPETFYIKAYLVDEESLRPLSTVYESAVYTHEMQEFLDKTVDDFDEDRVLNFDDSADNNFAVYKENVEVIDGDNSTSKLVSVDEENRKYVFNNADSEITSLKEGDIFVYENEDGTIVIINVASIEIDGDMATVYGQETTMEEVFDYVKIDTNMGTSEAVIDDSNLGEGITNNGYVEYDEPQTYAIISEAKVGGGVKYNIAKREWGDEKNKVEVKGDVELGVEASLKFYLTFSYYYLELKIDYSAKIVVEVTGQVSGEIEMSLFCFSPVPGLYIELTPAIVVELSVEVKVEGKLEGTIGTQKSSDGTSKSLNSTPEFDGSVEVEGKFFIGISLKPRVKLISDKIAKIELEAKVGAEVTVTKKWEPESDTEKHTCKNCLDGDISAIAQVKFEAKFFNNDRFAVKADLLDLKIKICDFYISIDNGEFGFTTCPHISYKITVYVVDSNGKYVMHAMVNEEYSTTDVGYVEMYLPTGDYVIKAVQGKEYGERNVYVADDAREIKIYIDENGGYGKNDTDDRWEDEKGNEEGEDKAEAAKYEYEICEDGTISITGYLGSDTEIVIPSKIDGKKVTRIGNGAFYYSGLNQISIPEGVTSIGDCAFSYSLLTKISIPKGLTSIGQAAFWDCSRLSEVRLLGVTSIGDCAFYGCSSLTEISLPEGVKSIGKEAFLGCSSLSKISLPEGVTSIGDYAFYGCSSLSKIIIPKGVTSIGRCTFFVCSSLGEVIIPEGVTSIGDYAFEGCSSLREMVIPEGVKSIGNYAFINCNSMSELILPEGVTNIGDYAFWGWSNLKEIKLPSTIKHIGCDSIGYYDYRNKHYDFVIYGYSGTVAEDYANENGFIFINLQSIPEEVNKTVIETYSIKQARRMEIGESTDIKSSLRDNTAFSNENYNDLIPNSVYNFYIFKSDLTSDRLSSDNLLYITQAISDENGQLNINYIPKEECEGVVKLLVGMNDYDILDAVITIDDITYTGEQQHVSVEVVYKGETLGQYVDYEISGDYVVTEVGEYNIVIEGKGKYTGKSSINFKVKKEFLIGDANNDAKIDTQDAVLLKKHLAGYTDLEINEEACDVNNDGEINSADAVILLKYLAGYDVGLTK